MGTHKAVLSCRSACSTSWLFPQIPSPLPGRLAQGGAWAYIGSHLGRGWPDKLQAEKVRRGLGVWMGRGSWGGLRLKEGQHWALTSDYPASATLSPAVKWATTGVEGSWAHSVPPWAQEKARAAPGSGGVEWRRWSNWALPPLLAFSWPHSCSCVPGRTMASAAAEAEKGSPIVVGLLVVGNIIILVRHPQCWELSGRVGRREQS